MAKLFDHQQRNDSSSSSFGSGYHRPSHGPYRPHQQQPSGGHSYGSAKDGGRHDYRPSDTNIAVLGLDPTDLPSIAKNFYQESPEIASLSAQDVATFRAKHEMTIQGRDVPRPIAAFAQAGFPPSILQRLAEDKFEQPTPIQAQGWPMALSGRNMVGIAQTGSGKTLSYVLPGLVHLMHQLPSNNQQNANYARDSRVAVKPRILVLAPTRELAIQIHEVARKHGQVLGCKSVVVFGGAPRRSQSYTLQRGVDLLIATPGRLIDFVQDKQISLEAVSYLVLDEADRMLDMGFEPQLRDLLPQIRRDRQVTMWSATWPKAVQRLARDLLGNDYIQVTIGSQELAANKKIHQNIQILQHKQEKDEALAKLLQALWDAAPGADEHLKQMARTIVFCNTKRDCDRLAYEMSQSGWQAAAMHGDLQQFERENVLRDFRSGHRPIFVCTDVAARGLDIKDVKVVINYDFPKNSEDYVHRIGRTARGLDTEGTAYSFFVPAEDRGNARDLVKLLREAEQDVPPALQDLAFPSRSGSYSSTNRSSSSRPSSFARGGYHQGAPRHNGSQSRYF